MNNNKEILTKDKSKEMKVANVYLEVELIEALDEISKIEYRKRSDLVRMILKKWVDENRGEYNV